jgi:hypothetical protein
MAELTVLDLGSDPRDRGKTHGRAMRTEIWSNYAPYIERSRPAKCDHRLFWSRAKHKRPLSLGTTPSMPTK